MQIGKAHKRWSNSNTSEKKISIYICSVNSSVCILFLKWAVHATLGAWSIHQIHPPFRSIPRDVGHVVQLSRVLLMAEGSNIERDGVLPPPPWKLSPPGDSSRGRMGSYQGSSPTEVVRRQLPGKVKVENRPAVFLLVPGSNLPPGPPLGVIQQIGQCTQTPTLPNVCMLHAPSIVSFLAL